MALHIASDAGKRDDVYHADRSSSGKRSRLPRVLLDFDLLVSNIERSIMSDQEKAPVQITPQDLLTKSNPGLYLQEKDLTNPRELYSFVSQKTKSTEDLRTAVKQELAGNMKNGGLLPHLSKAISMKDLRSGAKTDSMRKDGMPFVSMHQRNKNTKDLRNRKDGEEDKENLKNPHNFPQIKGYSDENKGDLARPPLHRDVSLPVLRKRHYVSRHEDLNERKTSELGGKINEPKAHESNGIVKRKLDKWFSEMPEEVFDKAQRALMEESIRDRLVLYQSKRQAKPDSLHPKPTGGSNARRVPNTYLQLSANLFENICQVENSDKLNKYKLKQKSLHNLKMHELDEAERSESRYIDKFDSNTRSMTVPVKFASGTPRLESRDRQQVFPVHVLSNGIVVCGDIQNEKSGLKTVSINDVALGAVRTPNEDSFHKGDNSETMYTNSIHHSKLPNKTSSEEDTRESKEHHSLERNMTRMNASTLNAHKDNSLKHTIQTVEMLRNARRERQNTVIIGSPIAEAHLNESSKWRQYGSSVENVHVLNDTNTKSFSVEKTENSNDDNMDKPMTLISTAGEIYMGDATSMSTTTRKHRQRSVLKKFNKLEVFSESQKNQMAISESYNSELKQFNENHQPASNTTQAFSGYKLDLKPYPQKSLLRYDSDIVKSEVRVQEVVFRFEPGEVIISKKPNAQNYEPKSSERARTIYGKSLVKEERKDVKDEGSRDNKSVKSHKTLYSTYHEPQRQENGKTEEKIRTERLLSPLSINTGKMNKINQQDTDRNHGMDGTAKHSDNKIEVNYPQNTNDSISTMTPDFQKRPETGELATKPDIIGPEVSAFTPPADDNDAQNGLAANSSSIETSASDIAQEEALTRNGLEEKEQLENKDSECDEIASHTDSMSIEIGFD
ncbi:hypothetical protein ACJMK2_029410 [Sinanodonta woodiana]|uniref:Uncharacterized protein n=1 Tax=Sinanodonta woodiana TaxID=1069815 RepID=A0ABD3XDP7_SINWO